MLTPLCINMRQSKIPLVILSLSYAHTKYVKSILENKVIISIKFILAYDGWPKNITYNKYVLFL